MISLNDPFQLALVTWDHLGNVCKANLSNKILNYYTNFQ